MIKVTFSVETNASGYIVNSTTECRLLGILLYRKTRHYPPEGYRGEYFIR